MNSRHSTPETESMMDIPLNRQVVFSSGRTRRNVPDISPEEIARLMLEIQATWSDDERQLRQVGHSIRIPYEIPTIATASMQ